MINEIYHFNTELLNIKRDKVAQLTEQEKAWLLTALREEVQELEDADNLVDTIDSLLDLIYFGVGGLIRLGLNPESIERCFGFVHEANMLKKSGVKATRPQDGSVADAVKPVDWIAPEAKIKAYLAGEIE